MAEKDNSAQGISSLNTRAEDVLLEVIDHRFTYHPPKGDQVERYGKIRAEAKALARTIALSTPASREQSLALTKLDEVVFWANAGIARGE